MTTISPTAGDQAPEPIGCSDGRSSAGDVAVLAESGSPAAGEFAAGWWDVGEAEYHASPLVSRGKLHLLRESPQAYHARVVTRELPEVEPSKALRVGRLLHVAVLQPDRFEREFCLPPGADIGPPEPPKPTPAEGTSPNTKAHRENLAAWRYEMEVWQGDKDRAISAYLRGREVVRPDEWETVLGCAVAISDCALASWLISGARYVEQSVRWQDPDTGLWCRARFDAADDPTVSDPSCADLKSLGRIPTPANFRRDVVAHWYHGQAAFYSDGYRAVTGVTPRFPFVVVHKDPPHEVAIYEIGPAEIELGRRQYKAALAELVWRTERDEWLAPWSADPQILTFDQWTFRDAEEWSSADG